MTIASVRPSRRRGTELMLTLAAVGIVVIAYVNVSLAATGKVPPDLALHTGILAAIVLSFHLVIRWRASYADPLILPIVTLLNGLGVVMIHRLDLAAGRDFSSGLAFKQLMWTFLGVAIAAGVLISLRDHRLLRRYTYTAAAIGFVLLLLPLLPMLGYSAGGARIWIKLGSFTFQPAEIAKIVLAIFFAGYLVQTRDVLSLAGRRILGITFPRGRDFLPVLAVWMLAALILVAETDLGTTLLLFGLFIAMLYVATERISWVIIGLGLAGFAAFIAYKLFTHVQVRVLCWLDPWSAKGLEQCGQSNTSMMGMASGGITGSGLGHGRPWLTPLAQSDFIFSAFAEELGLIAIIAIILLYVLLVERGLRASIGLRDSFGKLLAAGFAFTIALQVFVVVGGITRVIPMTGLTLPFMAYGGSSLLTNWTLAALLLRLSDMARRPLPEQNPAEMKPVALP